MTLSYFLPFFTFTVCKSFDIGLKNRFFWGYIKCVLPELEWLSDWLQYLLWKWDYIAVFYMLQLPYWYMNKETRAAPAGPNKQKSKYITVAPSLEAVCNYDCHWGGTGGFRHMNQAMKMRVKCLETATRYKIRDKIRLHTRGYIHIGHHSVTLATRGLWLVSLCC